VCSAVLSAAKLSDLLTLIVTHEHTEEDRFGVLSMPASKAEIMVNAEEILVEQLEAAMKA
jgi:hypothetical protein